MEDVQTLFERPLGKPVADAVKGADGVWRRKFASGTTVKPPIMSRCLTPSGLSFVARFTETAVACGLFCV